MRRRPLESVYAIVAFLASSGFAAFAVGKLVEADDSRGVAALALAAAYAVLAAGLFRRPGAATRRRASGRSRKRAAVAAALLLVEGTPLVAAAAALAVALAALNRVTGERRFAPAALVPLALAAGVTFVELAPPKDFFVANQSPGNGALAVALVAAALAALALLVRVPPDPPEDELDRVLDEAFAPARSVVSWLAAATGVYAGSLAILGLTLGAGDADLTTEFQRGHTAVSAFWGVVALLDAVRRAAARVAGTPPRRLRALRRRPREALPLRPERAQLRRAGAVVPRGRRRAPARRLLLPAARRAARRWAAAGLTRRR